jgi:hypothetical protein
LDYVLLILVGATLRQRYFKRVTSQRLTISIFAWRPVFWRLRIAAASIAPLHDIKMKRFMNATRSFLPVRENVLQRFAVKD